MQIFEWDEKKSNSNLRKHSASFVEAESVFYDPNSLTMSDPDHSDNQHRFIDIGTKIGFWLWYILNAMIKFD